MTGREGWKKRIVVVLGLVFLPIFLTGGTCGGEAQEVVEEEEEVPAAVRLQKRRNIYEGNVNENLQELRRDLDETAGERKAGQDQRIDETIGR